MVKIRLGNAAPMKEVRDPDNDERRTLVAAPEATAGYTEVECYEPTLQQTIATVADLWRKHSAEPPTWVSADDETVEIVLASNFDCPRGEPRAKAKKGAK